MSPSRSVRPPIRTVRLSGHTTRSAHATRQGFPSSRATTAPCEVRPPRAERIAPAALNARISSVSIAGRTRIGAHRLSQAPTASTSSATGPDATPGPADTARARTEWCSDSASRDRAIRSRSTSANRALPDAGLTTSSSIRSTAICNAAQGVRFADRVCSR